MQGSDQVLGNPLCPGLVQHWDRLPKEVRESPSCGAFEAQLDKATDT